MQNNYRSIQSIQSTYVLLPRHGIGSFLSHLNLSSGGLTLLAISDRIDQNVFVLSLRFVIFLVSPTSAHLTTPLVHLKAFRPDKNAPLWRAAEIADTLHSPIVFPLHRVQLDADPESSSKLRGSEVDDHPRVVARPQLDALAHFEPVAPLPA